MAVAEGRIVASKELNEKVNRIQKDTIDSLSQMIREEVTRNEALRATEYYEYIKKLEDING